MLIILTLPIIGFSGYARNSHESNVGRRDPGFSGRSVHLFCCYLRIFVLTMRNCRLCCKPFKTRGTLAKHQRLFHDGHSMDNLVPLECVFLTYFVNLVQQQLQCPLRPFVRDRCKIIPAASVLSAGSKRQRAETNCQNALKVLRATFRTGYVTPTARLPGPPSNSCVGRSTTEVAVTSTTVLRIHTEVAPLVPATKRWNISKPIGDALNRYTSQVLSSMLRQFRPHPQSNSDEGSCYDPCTPLPPSNGSSLNSDDQDCAVEVTNLDCSKPLAIRLFHYCWGVLRVLIPTFITS